MKALENLLAARRIVMKYGTNALTKVDEAGNVLGLDREKIGGIARIVNTLYDNGREPVIVSSAAVIAGMANPLNRLSLRPTNLEEQQDLASEGQSELMSAYGEALLPYGIGIMQLLVTHHNFATEAERLNIRKSVERSFGRRKLAIFNTNDPVTSEELVAGSEYGFTDNDPLASLVAIYCKIEPTSLIIVSENGHLGSGGISSKRGALLRAESNSIRTNLDIPTTHAILEEAVTNYFRPSG